MKPGIIVDSADWTGQPSEIREARGPYGGMISEALEAAIWRDEVREDRRQRLNALIMLWGPAVVDKGRTRRRSDDYVVHSRHREEEWTFGRALIATFALIFNRIHGRREVVMHKRRTGKSYVPSFDMGYWDARADGYGWSSMSLQLYPGARVEIISDGESWM